MKNSTQLFSVSTRAVLGLSLTYFLLACGNGDHMPVKALSGSSAKKLGQTAAAGGISYADVKPIFAARCTPCHAPGQPQPNWQDYATAFEKKENIRTRLFVKKDMPMGGKLSDDDAKIILAWLDAGAPGMPAAASATSSASSKELSVATDKMPADKTEVAVQSIKKPSLPAKAQTCVACHGQIGNSEDIKYPKLAGQQADYLANQILAFKNETRKTQDAQTFMWPQVSSLSDADIKEITEYFSAQKTSLKPASTKEERTWVKIGQEIYNKGLQDKGIPACKNCHGEDGHGAGLVPRLAGQHSEYIQNQIKEFQAGTRHEATMMPGFAKNLTPEMMQYIGAYIQQLE